MQIQFNSFAEFIAMGNHGLYVWLAFGFATVVVAWNVLQPILQRRRLLKLQTQRLRREKKYARTA